MEVAIVGLILFFLFLIARRQFRQNQLSNRTPKRTPIPDKKTPATSQTHERAQLAKGPSNSKPSAAPVPMPHVPAAVPEPFDAQSAKTEPPSTVVHGSAYVIDGDSIVIKKTQIRLFGVDAPELEHPFGNKAKWALVKLCKGKTIRAEVLEKDDYGRTVAKCTLPDGRDLSAEMVRIGMAIDWPKYSGGQYLALETPDARKKLWLADARQKGRMHVWRQFEARNASK